MKLELLKNKQEHAQSAVASQEVREHLAGFIRSKRLGSSSQLEISHHANQPASASSSSGGHQADKTKTAAFDSFIRQSRLNNNDSFARGGEDHPLRKTASMPTMHIPYKAQSLSRRRQMERRTTMSPLMKRKSRPKRQLFGSSSTEYSSNPCILQSKRPSARSLSQSSSPPPETNYYHTQQTGSIATPTSTKASCSSLSNPHKTSSCISGFHDSRLNQQNKQTASQTIELSSIFTNRELENIQNNLEGSLYFSGPMSTSSSNLNRSTTSVSNEPISPASPTSSDKSALTAKQQQHRLVNEAIRKTVIQRASNKGKVMTVSGSLDIESVPRAGRSSESNHRSGALNSGRPEEFRQWSLDAADLRQCQPLAKLQAGFANQTSSGMFFHRDLNKLRLATTSDAAILRRSLSPSSSISMGVSGSGQPAQAIGSGEPQYVRERIPHVGHSLYLKHYSSSSSSTSSLLSQQDSLDDSSSQAIDLSSSSEASRQRRDLTKTGSTSRRPQLASQLIRPGQASSASRNYQLLQDSFNQLQLCQNQQSDEMKRLLQGHQLYQQSPRTSSIQPNSSSHPPPLAETTKTAVSLDLSPNFPGKMISSLSQQYNLSASAQNLISLHQQQDYGSMLGGLRQQYQQQQQQQQSQQAQSQQQKQQASDMSQWLALAYLIQHANDLPTHNQGQPPQITSSMLAEVASLSEPYKSRILSHLIRQNQQQINMLQSLASETGELNEPGNVGSTTSQTDDHRSLIGRALSSPLITSAQRAESAKQALAQNTGDQVNLPPSSSNQQQSFTNQYAGSIADRSQLLAMNASSMIEPGHLKVAGSNLSLDLSVSSRSSDDKTAGTKSSKASGEHALSFTYKPANPRQTSCNFIYNPTFDAGSATGLVYELEMCNHKCICGNENNHPENSLRILAIWRRLYERGLMSRCAKVEGRRATIEELQLCHR